jgi:hypothetical protein
VATGAVVAIVSSQAAAGRVGCLQHGCAAQTGSRHAAKAAAGVAAGVALAAAGAALASESDADSAKPKPRPRPVPESGRWRLVREPDANDSKDGPAYYIEE